MTDPAESPCQTCGACCAYDKNWPRFSLEAEEDLALIPEALVALDKSGMRCEGNLRPDVCRACQPGDAECNIARAHYGFPQIRQ